MSTLCIVLEDYVRKSVQTYKEEIDAYLISKEREDLITQKFVTFFVGKNLLLSNRIKEGGI